MNKQAKIKLIFLSLIGIFLLASFAIGAGQTADIPTITLTNPGVLSTVENREGRVKINYTSLIPTGDSDNPLHNITLYINWTPNINHTWFVDPYTSSFPNNKSIGNTTLSYNQTFGLTGVSNITEFTNLTLLSGYYLNFQALVCSNVTGLVKSQGNCTWSANTTIYVDKYYDDTNPWGAITWPTNGTVVSNQTMNIDMPINFSITDDDYLYNVTLWMNYSTAFYWPACNSSNILSNGTLDNIGTISPFINNTDNTTIIGNFTDWGRSKGFFGNGSDGFYCAYIETRDFNNNTFNSTTVYWEIDNTPGWTMQFINNTITNTCSEKEFKFNVSEPSNISIYYSTNVTDFIMNYSDSTRSYVSDTAFTNGSRIINLTGLLSYKTYYFNITICDENHNCNYTAQDDNTANFLKEYSACAGWNAYGLLADATMLKDIASNVSDSTIVSLWNRTTQAWMNYVVGVATNQNLSTERGMGIFIYTENDSVVIPQQNFMNNKSYTEAGNWSVNLSGGQSGSYSNWTFIGILQDWTMGNITANTEIRDNVTVVSYYNNSLAGYQDHIWGYSINNNTGLGAGDTLWLWPKVDRLLWYRNMTIDQS